MAKQVRTWKVEVLARGVVLTLNGKAYRIDNPDPIIFDMQRAAEGYAGTYEGAAKAVRICRKSYAPGVWIYSKSLNSGSGRQAGEVLEPRTIDQTNGMCPKCDQIPGACECK